MAGDWIKMRTDLASDPAVFHMADLLGVSEFEVVGMLHKFWSWADTHTENGNAPGVTEERIDRYMCVTGFAKALAEGDGKTPWLIIYDGGIRIPKFEDHNGKSAKTRALTNKRVQKKRSEERNANVTRPALQKRYQRREEKSIKDVVHTTTEASTQGSARNAPGGSGGTAVFDFVKTINDEYGGTGIPQGHQLTQIQRLIDRFGIDRLNATADEHASALQNKNWGYRITVLRNHAEKVVGQTARASPATCWDDLPQEERIRRVAEKVAKIEATTRLAQKQRAEALS